MSDSLMNIPFMRRIHHIHFIGIGGAGMGGIAEVLLNQGYSISGSDQSDNRVTHRLKSLGAKVFLNHGADNIQKADVVVVSTAIPESNPELIAAKQKRIPVVSRAEMLSELMRFRYGIAVAGTHGKTTTTSLTASILGAGKLDPTFVIGGLVNSVGSNARLGTSRFFVAEADESDASFLYLQPMMAIVTNIDADHLVNYDGDFNRLIKTFIEFIHHLPFYGVVVLCIDDPVVRDVIPKIGRPIITYGFDESADVRAIEHKQSGVLNEFKVLRKGSDKALILKMNLPGKHNVLNAMAAIAVATELGVSDKDIQKGLAEFSGIGRRFQIHGDFTLPAGPVKLIDDYGHHPREVAVTIAAIRSAWPERRLVMTYQPHRYSRTKDLFEDFSSVLSDVDVLLMLNVYAAGEESIPGADSRALCRSIRQRGKVDPIFVEDKQNLNDCLLDVLQQDDILLMQGAGDIGVLASELAKSDMKLKC